MIIEKYCSVSYGVMKHEKGNLLQIKDVIDCLYTILDDECSVVVSLENLLSELRGETKEE